MVDFYIITGCSEQGLCRKAKQARRITQKYPEAKILKFQSPEEIKAAQAFCEQSGISVTAQESGNHASGPLGKGALQ